MMNQYSYMSDNSIALYRNNNFLSKIIISILMLTFVFIFLPIEETFEKSIIIGIEFIFIILFSIINIIVEINRRHFSLNLIHWLYIFLFLGCAGISQFSTNSFLWNLKPDNNLVSNANLLIILWCFTYCFVHYVSKNKNKKSNAKTNDISFNNKTKIFCFIILIILIILSFYSLLTIDFSMFFSREKYNQYSIIGHVDSSSLKLLLNSLIRGACLWVSIIYLSILKNKKTFINIISFIVALFCCFVLVPPLGVARYVFAATYGAMLLFYFDILKKSNLFIYIFIIGTLFLFPMLNAFRGYTISSLSQSVGNVSDNFIKADYDSYTMLIYTIKYTDVFSITFGKQLFSVLLFFIPSSLWGNKSVGSGSLIIETFEPSIPSNVSCPFIGEGLINFGIFGVLFFCFLIAKFIKWFDGWYWNNEKKSIWLSMFYPFAVMFLLFVLRGDLLSSYSFFMGYAATFLIFYLVSKIKVGN